MKIIFLVALLAVSMAVQSQQPSPTPAKAINPPQKSSPQSTQQPPTEQSVTIKSPVSIQLLNTGKSPQEAERESRNEDGKATREGWVIALTGIAAAATVALAFITGFLVRYTKRLWGSTSALVIGAEDTAKKELRAYLGVASGVLYFLPSNALRAAIEIKNFGQTPAHKVVPAIAGDLRDPAADKVFEDPAFIPHRQPISPTSSWTFGHEFHGLSDQQIQDVLADRKLVFIWGRVKYEDIFGAEQTLKFRFRNVVKELSPDGAHIQRWYFYPEDEGNEAT